MNKKYNIYPTFIGKKNKVKATIKVIATDDYSKEAQWLKFSRNVLNDPKSYELATLTFLMLDSFEEVKPVELLDSPKYIYTRDEQCLVAFMLALLNMNIAEGNIVNSRGLEKAKTFTIDDTVEFFLNLAAKLHFSETDIDFLLKFFVRFEYVDYLNEEEIILFDDNER